MDPYQAVSGFPTEGPEGPDTNWNVGRVSIRRTYTAQTHVLAVQVAPRILSHYFGLSKVEICRVTFSTHTQRALTLVAPNGPLRHIPRTTRTQVSFIRRGKFCRLFNALLPADDPSHELGVPEYHEHLVPGLLDRIDRGFLAASSTVRPGPAWKLT